TRKGDHGSGSAPRGGDSQDAGIDAGGSNGNYGAVIDDRDEGGVDAAKGHGGGAGQVGARDGHDRPGGAVDGCERGDNWDRNRGGDGHGSTARARTRTGDIDGGC